MSEAPAKEKPRYVFHMIVPHGVEPRVLLVEEDGGWVLPHYSPEPRFFAMVSAVPGEVRQLLGIEVSVLRCVMLNNERESRNEVHCVFALENLSPGQERPEGSRWAGREELDGVQFALPGQREAVEKWLDYAETGVAPPLRSPWAIPGWQVGAEHWIAEQLEGLGIRQSGPVQQIKTWGISCLLKAATEQGDVYFKAVPRLFRHEPAITAWMARQFPGEVPAPLATMQAEDESWMLLGDMGGVEMRDNPGADREAVFRMLGAMQVACVGRGEEMLAEGFADRRLERLAEQISWLLVEPGVGSKLEAGQMERLRELAPTLKGICTRLAEYNVPQTLIHGDFHEGNVYVAGGRHIIFDWTDGAVSHPFFDLLTELDYDVPKDDAGEKARLIDAYLDCWTGYEPMERLREAFGMAQTLAAVHHAVSYYYINASLEPDARWELEGAESIWLKRALLMLDEQG